MKKFLLGLFSLIFMLSLTLPVAAVDTGPIGLPDITISETGDFIAPMIATSIEPVSLEVNSLIPLRCIMAENVFISRSIESPEVVRIFSTHGIAHYINPKIDYKFTLTTVATVQPPPLYIITYTPEAVLSYKERYT